jgi:hypothetical protein
VSVLCFELFVNAFAFLVESKRLGQKVLPNGFQGIYTKLNFIPSEPMRNLNALCCRHLCKPLGEVLIE